MIKMMKPLMASVAMVAVAVAFENKPGWKLDADGKVELKNGNPVYVNSAGDEQEVQGDTISRLNQEAQTHRTAKEAAEAALLPFKGIDPEAAKKAIETVGKINAKQLIDAGEVDRVRDTIKAEFTTQLTEKDKALSEQQIKIDGMLVDKVFDASEFVQKNIAVPVDMFQSSFRGNFKVEDGKVIAYGRDGNKLLSKERQGEYATPDEALRLLVDMHPQKDTILKANIEGGSGNDGGGGNRGQGATIRRADFLALTPQRQSEIATKGEVKIVD